MKSCVILGLFLTLSLASSASGASPMDILGALTSNKINQGQHQVQHQGQHQGQHNGNIYQNDQKHFSQRQPPSLLQTALRYGLLSGLQSSGGAFSNGEKGFQYFMQQYGPLAQVLTEDVMDTIGLSRNIKMAIPMVGKIMMLGMYLVMNFSYEMRSLQPSIKAGYEFLRHFNKQETKVYNDVTDEVFTALDRQMERGNYLY